MYNSTTLASDRPKHNTTHSALANIGPFLEDTRVAVRPSRRSMKYLADRCKRTHGCYSSNILDFFLCDCLPCETNTNKRNEWPNHRFLRWLIVEFGNVVAKTAFWDDGENYFWHFHWREKVMNEVIQWTHRKHSQCIKHILRPRNDEQLVEYCAMEFSWSDAKSKLIRFQFS